MQMQLVGSVSIPRAVDERSLILDPPTLKKLRKKSIISAEAYVLLAIQMTYSHKDPHIQPTNFCEEWGLMEHELDSAIAKLQKKGLAFKNPEVIQLELLED